MNIVVVDNSADKHEEQRSKAAAAAHSLGVSVEHCADGLDLIAVEFGAAEAAQNRHRASDLTMNVARVGRYQHLRTQCRHAHV